MSTRRSAQNHSGNGFGKYAAQHFWWISQSSPDVHHGSNQHEKYARLSVSVVGSLIGSMELQVPSLSFTVQVPPAWNRIIFYDGSLFHSADIGEASLRRPDAEHGRLTFNSFITCRRAAR